MSLTFLQRFYGNLMKSCLLELHDDGLVRGGVHDVLTTQVNVRTRHDGFVGHLKTILFYFNHAGAMSQ